MKIRKTIKLLKSGKYDFDKLPIKLTSCWNPRIQKLLVREVNFENNPWVYAPWNYMKVNSDLMKSSTRSLINGSSAIFYLLKLNDDFSYEFDGEDDEGNSIYYKGPGWIFPIELNEVRPCTKNEIEKLEKIFNALD